IATSNRFSLLGHENLPDSGHDPGPSSRVSAAANQNHRLASVSSEDRDIDETPSKHSAIRSLSKRDRHSIVATSTRPIVEVPKSPTPPSRAIIKLPGYVRSRPAVILIDSGATGNFVASKFAASAKLALTAGPPNTTHLPNGAPKEAH